MKIQIYLLLIVSLLIGSLSYARPVNTVKKNPANGSDPLAWSLGRLPQNGDSVVIPATFSLTVDFSASFNSLRINIQGTLIFNHTSLTLDNSSVVYVAATGTIKGKNLAANEFISLGGINKFVGNIDGPITGVKFASALTGVSPNGFSTNFALLPVTFTSFTVSYDKNNVELIKWNTENEINVSYFEIERSMDAVGWEVIGKVLSAGNSLSNNYQFTDTYSLGPVVYYRIRQVDLDQKYAYSKIEVLKENISRKNATIIASNKTIRILFNSEVRNRVVVRLVNLNGLVIQQQSYDARQAIITIPASNVKTGIYVVQITDGSEMMQVAEVGL